MIIFTTALAETAETTNLTAALEGVTKQEAAVAGAVFGAIGVLTIAWIVLQIIADWKIFTKAGEPGWKSIIPFYNYYTEYKMCWNGGYGLLFAAAFYINNLISSGKNLQNWQTILFALLFVVMLVLHFKQSLKLAKAFGKGTGFGVCLFVFGPIARMVLGFGSARYVGKDGHNLR